ncbi:hypothetical protein [Spiroplasma attinicola]|uniref:hypothetical protein n=1 Tax=Spiroplasma attinicola TaxID=2904537 RepID=UPI002022AC41|nr:MULTISPECIES: hypothetical protein [unclassified Spiroplasma]MCL8210008.1 hypothetical protein [Spiroplasma sp. JKS002670]MCL8210959.1 hypothetical protein [Spiroplasma sp. JKS002671]
MKLKEVLPELLFIHNNEIKYKLFSFDVLSICLPISFNLLNSVIKDNLNNLNNSQKINNNEEVILWNITDFELDFYYDNEQKQWFFHNEKNHNFYSFDWKFKNIFLPKINNESQNFFYKGKIKFNVIDGKIDEESIIFDSNKNSWMEISKVNGLLFKELNSIDNLIFNKKCILNINFHKNLLLTYINEANNNLKGNYGTSFEIKQTLKIIKYCILQSDFYNCLNNIRSIRNLIFSHIYEEIFLPIYSSLRIVNEELLWRKKRLNQSQDAKIIIKFYEKKLNRIINWYKQYKPTKGLNNYKIAEFLINEREEYYKKLIYFSEESFENLTEEKFSTYQVENSKIIKFIENKILNEDELISFKTANLLTNNSVHKNNYNRVSYQGWYLKNNELNILKRTLEVYLNIFIKFQNNISSYKLKIEELEKELMKEMKL